MRGLQAGDTPPSAAVLRGEARVLVPAVLDGHDLHDRLRTLQSLRADVRADPRIGAAGALPSPDGHSLSDRRLDVPLFLLPLAGLAGAGKIASGGTQADTVSAGEVFFAAPADRAAEKDLQRQFDALGLSGLSVTASSAEEGGRTIRIVAAKFSRLKKVSHGDRARLLQMMEVTADESFPDDEVFLGLRAASCGVAPLTGRRGSRGVARSPNRPTTPSGRQPRCCGCCTPLPRPPRPTPPVRPRRQLASRSARLEAL